MYWEEIVANIVIKEYDKFEEELCEKWNDLYKEGAIYNLSPQWCKLWFENFNQGKKLNIIAIYDKRDNLKLVAPFYLKNNILSLIGTKPVLFDECNILSVDKEHIQVLLDYIFEKNFDINFEHVNSQSDFANILSRYLCESKVRHTAHLTETKQIINKEFNPKHGEIKNINRQKRYVENNMEDNLVFEYDTPKTEKHIQELIRLHKKRWNGGMLEKKNNMQNFFENLMVNIDNVKLSRLALASKDVTVAYELGIIDSNNKYWFLMSAYNYDYNKISPGKVLMYELTKHLLENGVEVLDLGRGCETYKGGYSNEENVLIHFISYNSCPVGRLYIRISELIEKTVKKIRAI